MLRAAECIELVAALEKPPRRKKDLLAAAWLAERVAKAERRAGRVQAVEEGRVEKEREKERRVRRMCVRNGLDGHGGVDVVACGRGKRVRGEVCYGEEDVDDVEDGWDGEPGDEFVVEDGASGESGSESELGSDAEEEEVVEVARLRSGRVAGRVRVMSGGRVTRARARVEEECGGAGRPVRKCRRVALA